MRKSLEELEGRLASLEIIRHAAQDRSSISGSEPNAALRVGRMVRQETQKGQVMDLTQAFLLGIMVAWTPSLIVLAVLLRDIR
jgi:hypothetical protein